MFNLDASQQDEQKSCTQTTKCNLGQINELAKSKFPNIYVILRCLCGSNNEGTLDSAGIASFTVPQYQLSQSELIPKAGVRHRDLISR